MKRFETFSFDLQACHEELNAFRTLLHERDELKERRDILPFFRTRTHLSAFIGSYFPYLVYPDRIAFEYDLFGDFRCDLAIGDASSEQYCFVEFEEATASSLFVSHSSKATPEWSPRFEHGFSQVLDWFWKLSDMEGTTEFAHRLGGSASYEGVLIIGRDRDLPWHLPKDLKYFKPASVRQAANLRGGLERGRRIARWRRPRG